MLQCSVRRKGSSLLLDVEGKLIPALAYVTYNPAGGRYAQFAGQGIRIFSVTVYMGDRGINPSSGIRSFRPGCWKQGDTFDFSPVKEDFQRILNAVPDALIFPRIYFDVPLWWEGNHPLETAQDQGGHPLRQSFASEVWLSDCRRGLQNFYVWLSQSGFEDHVIGCQMAAGGTEEWAYPWSYQGQMLDYSPVNRKAFSNWLCRKYGGDIARLNCAWQTGFDSFDKAGIPLPAERKYARYPGGEAGRNVTDYYLYHSIAVANAIVRLCSFVKETSGGKLLAGAFYGYDLEISDPDVGHCALKYVLESDCVDFLASPADYMKNRAQGVDWSFMAPVESVMLHNKLWFVEADVRTSLTRFLKDSMPFAVPDNQSYEAEVWKGPETLSRSADAMAKVFARALTHGTALWWFDMWAGWYDHPQLMGIIHSAFDIYRQAMLKGGGPAAAQTAVIVDEMSYVLFPQEKDEVGGALARLRLELGFMGAPYDTYLYSDLKSIPVENYKLFLILNAEHISAAQKEELKSHCAADGRTLVWLGGSMDCQENIPELPSEGKECYTLQTGGDGNSVLALVKEKDCCEVFSAASCLSAKTLRKIAVLSGVHVYCHTDDVVYAGNGFAAIHAASDGQKRLYFPECTDGECIMGNGGAISGEFYHDLKMSLGETVIWRITPHGEGRNDSADSDKKKGDTERCTDHA